MIKIINGTKDFTDVEKYLMTISPAIVSMKDVEDGESITVAGVLNFQDVKDDGGCVDIMSIITPDNKVYSCQSATFKRSVNDIASLLPNTEFSIIKTSGVTKAGRNFINCVLDTAKL